MVEPKPVVVEQYVKVIPREVKIETSIEWSESRIEEQIRKVFWEEPDLAVAIAKCEGITNGKLDPFAFNPTNGSDDKGIFQISTLHHGVRVEELGLDMFDVQDNLTYAKILFDSQGTQPWSASKHCWGVLE